VARGERDLSLPRWRLPMTPLWQQPAVIEQSQLILNSFQALLGRELIERSGDASDEAQRLFEADFAVVSHGTEDDPILNYGNATALALWELTFEHFTQTPSRLTAEPQHRDERATLLERTTYNGYVDDYQGIRISKSGRRFRIRRAIVWNLSDAAGDYAGQAATFSDFEFLASDANHSPAT
jgi:hypothetical protein